MKPIANVMVGYITEEPKKYNHGSIVGERPTFFLRVFYPHKKDGWTKEPKEVLSPRKKTRRFPFIIHPRLLAQIKAGGPWRGQFVCVTYYPEIIERANKGYAIVLYATNVESLLQDFPESHVSEDRLWIDANSVAREIEDVEI